MAKSQPNSFQASVALQQSYCRDHGIPEHENKRGTNNSAVSEGEQNMFSLSYGILFLLAAVSYGPDAMVNFEAVYGILSLQYLGVPVYLLSINGVLCSSMSMFLIPTLGSWADKSTNPKKRRRMSLLISLSALTFGFGLLVLSCGFKANELRDIVKLSNFTQERDSYVAVQSRNSSDRVWPNSTFTVATQFSTTFDPLLPTKSDLQLTTQVLGILGYMFLDIAFDTSMSQIKTFLIDSVPEHQNTLILTMSTFVGALGGVLVSFMGIFDLPLYLGPVLNMDGIAVTVIFICCGIAVSALLGYTTSLTTSYLLTHRTVNLGEEQPLLPSRNPSEFNVAPSLNEPSAPRSQRARKPDEWSTGDGAYPCDKKPLDMRVQKSETERKVTFASQWAFVFNKRLILLFTASFLSFGVVLVMCVYISNTLTIEVLKGDPQALPGTPAKARYEQGLRDSSMGLLLTNLIYVAISPVNSKLINFFGAKPLFLLSNVLMCGACTLFCTVQTVSTFYFLMIVNGMYRAMIYTLPFLLATTLSQNKDNSNGTSASAKPEHLAKVISLLGFLFTSNYFILSCLMGPVMDAVGSAWPPAYYLIGSCAVAIFPLSFLLFM